MTISDVEKLAARHMRFQRDLLALQEHMGRAWRAMRSDGWAEWVAERQRLVDRLGAQDGVNLAEDTWAARAASDPELASRLAAFQELEVGTMEAILRQDERVRAAARGQVAALSRRLRSVRNAQVARREYGGHPPAVRSLSRRG